MTKRNLIIGAGGHGKVIADMMLRQGLQVLGFVDDDPSTIGHRILNLPVLGKTLQWRDFDPDGMVVAVGNNAIRQSIIERLEQDMSPPWITIRHSNAVIANSVQIGEGTVIMAGTVINVDTTVGKHSIINTGATIDHDCRIGNFVHIAPGVNLAGGVSIGQGTLMGIGSCAIPYSAIGEWVTVGAGATVVDDIADKITVVGTPARPLTSNNHNWS